MNWGKLARTLGTEKYASPYDRLLVPVFGLFYLVFLVGQAGFYLYAVQFLRSAETSPWLLVAAWLFWILILAGPVK